MLSKRHYLFHVGLTRFFFINKECSQLFLSSFKSEKELVIRTSIADFVRITQDSYG